MNQIVGTEKAISRLQKEFSIGKGPSNKVTSIRVALHKVNLAPIQNRIALTTYRKNLSCGKMAELLSKLHKVRELQMSALRSVSRDPTGTPSICGSTRQAHVFNRAPTDVCLFSHPCLWKISRAKLRVARAQE